MGSRSRAVEPLTTAQFMTRVSVGDMVHLKGDYQGDPIVWDTVSLQPAE